MPWSRIKEPPGSHKRPLFALRAWHRLLAEPLPLHPSARWGSSNPCQQAPPEPPTAGFPEVREAHQPAVLALPDPRGTLGPKSPAAPLLLGRSQPFPTASIPVTLSPPTSRTESQGAGRGWCPLARRRSPGSPRSQATLHTPGPSQCHRALGAQGRRGTETRCRTNWKRRDWLLRDVGTHVTFPSTFLCLLRVPLDTTKGEHRGRQHGGGVRDLEGPPCRPPPGAAALAAPASRGAHDAPRQQRGRYALGSVARAWGSAQVALHLRVLLTATFQGSQPRPLTFSGQLPFCWQVTGPSPRRATETLPCSGQVRAGENEAVPSARRQQVLGRSATPRPAQTYAGSWERQKADTVGTGQGKPIWGQGRTACDSRARPQPVPAPSRWLRGPVAQLCACAEGTTTQVGSPRPEYR